MKTQAIQAVLYNPPPEEFERFCRCLASLWIPDDWTLELRTGDCGEPTHFPDFFRPKLEEAGIAWTHVHFGENLGFGKGHNRLFNAGPSERVWMLNPDALFSRDVLVFLSGLADQKSEWGIVEPRLSPLEHPKDVDVHSYQTGWCSGCAPLVNSKLFEKVGGFDEGFFLYGEDVDLSWRIKAAGGKLYCSPLTSVYHIRTGEPSESERLWSQVSELLLLRKYGRKGHLQCRLGDLALGNPDWFKQVLSETALRLDKLGRSTEAERSAASWSGRLNSPLRWHPHPLHLTPASFTGKVALARNTNENSSNEEKIAADKERLESALGVWAAGGAVLSEEFPDHTLPMDTTDGPADIELKGGQTPFPGGLPPKLWLTSSTVACGYGWFSTGVSGWSDSASGVQRQSGGVKTPPIRDPEGWRFWVRRMRAVTRLRNLSPDLAELVRRIMD